MADSLQHAHFLVFFSLEKSKENLTKVLADRWFENILNGKLPSGGLQSRRNSKY